MVTKRTAWFVIAICVLIMALGLACIWVYRWATQSTTGLLFVGENVSSQNLVKNLSSADQDLVMTALNLLARRRDPTGRAAAHKLLQSNDDYIWFNACQYLAAIQDERAVPYLIKGLKHPAWRAHDDVAEHLERLTGEKHAKDQKKWIEWWEEAHPDTDFDFEYKNLKKEALALSTSSQILINGVADPLRISHCGPQIRLIGVKLKEDADRGKAVSILKNAVLFQFVQLEFDSGAKLDEEGARRALVYWVRQGQERLSRFGRRGLPPVPFKKRTLVNAFLLKSGLYEPNLNEVNDAKIRSLLESAVKEAAHNDGINSDG